MTPEKAIDHCASVLKEYAPFFEEYKKKSFADRSRECNENIDLSGLIVAMAHEAILAMAQGEKRRTLFGDRRNPAKSKRAIRRARKYVSSSLIPVLKESKEKLIKNGISATWIAFGIGDISNLLGRKAERIVEYGAILSMLLANEIECPVHGSNREAGYAKALAYFRGLISSSGIITTITKNGVSENNIFSSLQGINLASGEAVNQAIKEKKISLVDEVLPLADEIKKFIKAGDPSFDPDALFNSAQRFMESLSAPHEEIAQILDTGMVTALMSTAIHTYNGRDENLDTSNWINIVRRFRNLVAKSTGKPLPYPAQEWIVADEAVSEADQNQEETPQV
jgi:hypothetical protein